ncbi:nucleotidyltransferase domain protein [Ferrovum myxofaciens]|uniref:Nucleotidyltransferase domain protein n=1 Tax=Ferrovum myxofaciens TaxID=416213 RepID=A0A149VWM3_9PROT|nr:nucleotidyltransferase domain-containing protein [Ferrovum myxofaciens]KXW57304.1 nucleotidyltransferase domain protein [Ferrovum myxofaciens]
MNTVELNAPTLIRKRIEANRIAQSTGRFDFAKNVAAPALAKAFNAKRVWLFGSTARNDATSDSDIDLLVEGGAGLTAKARLSLAYDVVCSLDGPCGCDVIILTENEIAEKAPISFIVLSVKLRRLRRRYKEKVLDLRLKFTV